jgi:hypothetical protein
MLTPDRLVGARSPRKHPTMPTEEYVDRGVLRAQRGRADFEGRVGCSPDTIPSLRECLEEFD